MKKGLIVRSVGSSYEILDEESNIVRGKLPGKFKLEEKKLTNPIAVGDEISFNPPTFEGADAEITAIFPRKNYIIRRSSRKKAFDHIIASNIDQAVLVVTLVQPRTSLGFINRFLAAAESFRIPSILIFNKFDLLNDQQKDKLYELITTYENIGYCCKITSVADNEGIAIFKKLLENKKTLIAGHSGTGKSSLVNTVFPDLNIRIGEVSKQTGKGSHTTVYAEMFPIDDTTFLIDTPGIKEFGPTGIESGELSHFFPEMRALIGECKYHNCLHSNEPKCAVKEAVELGEIAESRYKSYLTMIHECR